MESWSSFWWIRRRLQILLPEVAFGDLLHAREAMPHEAMNVGSQDASACEVAEAAEGHRKAQLVGETCGSIAQVLEGVIVLEGAEAAGDHAVAEEAWWVEGFNEALVELRETELPALPANDVVVQDQALGAAAFGVSDEAHAEIGLNYGQVCREQKAALDGSLNGNGLAELEEMGHAFSLLLVTSYRDRWIGGWISRREFEDSLILQQLCRVVRSVIEKRRRKELRHRAK
jgi:hypothetical protein